MRRAWIIAGSIVGVVVVIIIAVFVYAVLNLNSIIQANRTRIIDKVSQSLGRKVEVASIKASLGWGVAMDLNGVTVADDPAFSNRPMLVARDIYCRVELMPLLSKDLRITSLVIAHPEIRMIRDRAGELNISTIGKHKKTPPVIPPASSPPADPPPAKLKASPMEAAPAPKSAPSALSALYVRNLSITNGRIDYIDRAGGGKPIVIRDVDLDVNGFRASAPFRIKLALAALGNRQNFKLDGMVGPLMHQGAIDFKNVPLELGLEVGPLELAELKAFKPLSKAIPEKLSITGPITAKGSVSGRLDESRFKLNADLSSNRVAWAGMLDKASGVTLSLVASGSRGASGIKIDEAHLRLADLNLKAAHIAFGAGRIKVQLDSNRFDLARLARTIVPLASYKASGHAELHANVALANHKPSIRGTLALNNVALSPGGKVPALAGLTGSLTMDGNSADIGPLAFMLGSSRAQLTAHARSLEPIDATYIFTTPRLRPAELVPSRAKAGPEVLNNLKIAGTVTGSASAPAITTKVTSPSGTVNHVSYTNLDLAAQYAQKVVTVESLKLGAFSGTLAATARAELAASHRFNVTADLKNINVQQALESQQSKAAGIVRGLVTGNVRVSGAGRTFDQIKPTLAGNGKVAVANGKLIGVNVVATALKKVDNVPGIGSLLPMGVIRRHPELFKNPNTDLDQASLSFVLQGPRVTTHDLTVRSADYSLLGNGWFDLNKQINMAARILLTRQLSQEITAEKKNAVYLQNAKGEIDIPLRVTGALPKPQVMPDVGELAQRAASQAVKQKGEKFIGKFLGKKGVGGILGGGSGGSGATPQATAAPSNPLAPFKKLF